MLTMITKDLP